MKKLFLLPVSLSLVLLTGEKIEADFSIGKNTAHETQKTLYKISEKDSGNKENPVIPGDFADPSLIRSDDLYYATGTSSEWAPHFPLFQSTDLINWHQMGYVLPKTPSWAAASFWAPELFYWKGTYYVYYVARKKIDGISCIGVATAKDPAKGFTDRGIVLEYGKEAIDPFIMEENGELYMTWKAYGLDSRPIEILGCRLSDDGLKMEGTPFMLLRDDDKEGIEGQCMVKKGDYYYLFYSLGACCGRQCSYQANVARSESLQGPYVKFAGNPILAETEEWKCAGHGTMVSTKSGKDFYLYHAYNKYDHVYTGRQGMLGQVLWDKQSGWPSVKPVGDEAEPIRNFRDDFSNDEIFGSWQWDFRNTKPGWKLQKGQLYLSGKVNATNETGTALTVRPFSGDYEMMTAVINQNASLKGLVLYGDANQSAGIGIKDDTILVWEVKKQKRSLLSEIIIKSKTPVYLKMKVEAGFKCRFFWSDAGKNWEEMKTTDNYYNGDFLPPWDRSPRPGLLHMGSDKDPAGFDFFEIRYK